MLRPDPLRHGATRSAGRRRSDERDDQLAGSQLRHRAGRRRHRDDVRRRPSYERFVNIGLVVLALLVGFMLPILLGRPLLTWVVPAAIASAVVLIGLWQGAQRVIPLRKNVYDYLIRFAGMAGLTAGVLVLLSRLHR